ncbi:TIGR03792 family protein [[Limnothrix rosea] IAM M-220]|uniref:TIGR03792 family protein n=1 Tax=[Limnothrix rosea] IAM M-220 TaxID=454133 RepID=UPI00095E7E9D|nr:TIGR03792 family protein [[Limnothrix rosea] IAM M-220]OKH15228.1 hypothetical protein NIES208_12715 [[Limnothrix rosea] IAM M-220]
MNNLKTHKTHKTQQKIRSFVACCLSYLIFLGGVALYWAAPVAASQDTDIIEWLQFEVPQEEQALFIAKETEIWDPINRRSPEYRGKEIWQDSRQPNQLIMINHWQGIQHKQTITQATIQAAEKAFDEAVGKTYPILQSKTFRVLPLQTENP